MFNLRLYKVLATLTILEQPRTLRFQDALAYACLANLKHGKPLEQKERKKAICEYIKLNVQLSNVQIASNTGVNEITIRRYRQELESKSEIKPQEKRLGADGKAYRNIPASTNVEADPFDECFSSHVISDDVFNVLADDPLKYDLIIVDPPYGKAF